MNISIDEPRRTPWLQHYVTVLLAMLALTGLIDLYTTEYLNKDIVRSASLNLHHIVAALGLIIILARGYVIWPTLTINLFFMALFVVSGIAGITLGIHAMFFNSIYCFYICMLGFFCCHELTRGQMLAALRGAAWIVFGAVTIKNIFYWHDILATISSAENRIDIPSLAAGGGNLEATYIIFCTAFLRGTRMYWPAFIYALIIAVIYSSRAAIIGGLALLAYEMIAPKTFQWFKSFRAPAFAIIILGILIASSPFPIIDFVVSRFQNIGYEPGSQGRLTLWEGAPAVFMKHPLGVGAGNSIHQIELAIGHDVTEDNMHDVYLQILLDLGIVGFGAYLCMIYSAARRAIANRLANPLWIAIGLYFLMGFLEFRAYDPFLFFWLGLAWYEPRTDHADA